MNQTIAEYLATLSLLSAIVPLLLILFYLRSLPTLYRYIAIPLGVSLFFDLFSSLNILFQYNLFEISKYFDAVGILAWGIIYLQFFGKLNHRKNWYLIFWVGTLFLTVLSLFQSTEGQSTNYIGANIYNLFHILASLSLIIILLTKVNEWSRANVLCLLLLIINLTYFSLIVGVYAFFGNLAPEEMMKVFVVKWLAYIIFNISLAIIIYSARSIPKNRFLDLS